VFHGGLTPEIREEGWKWLLGHASETSAEAAEFRAGR
jgi:hypothetical protein